MDDKGGGAAPVGIAVAGVALLGGLAAVLYFMPRREVVVGVWEVGDVLSCLPADPGHFTVLDKRNGEYHIGEGDPPIDDLGWWSETALLSLPWACIRV